MKEDKMIQAAKSGFTLVELLVVVAILGILATMAVVGLADKPDQARIQACEANVVTIKNACVTYNLEHKKMPKSIDDLTEENADGVAALEGSSTAPWGNDYKLEIKGKKVIVISAGPDGEMGTDDDIRSDTIGKKKKND